MGKELPQGHRLGDYSIERVLSRSGLQTVYVAKQGSSGRTCRLIVYSLDPDSESWQRYKSDLGQLGALNHPVIAELLEAASTPEGLAYAVWAQPAGEDLGSRLRRGGALTLREALSLGRQVAAALHASHRIDVLHRDLVPDNIYLVAPAPEGPAPEFEPVLLYGFGAARLLEGALSGVALVGHPEYMAPEQITGLSIDVGPATDQYALALILYQALSASQPFRAESAGAALLKVVRSTPEPLRALRPDLPTHVDEAVSRGLARERQARFADLPAFIAALSAGEKLPAGLLSATDSWLGGSVQADEALHRALAAGRVTPSLGVVAQSLGEAAGVPEVVEDSATVPNTMEAVMRLAVPPEAPPPPEKEPSGPLELETLDPTPQPQKIQTATPSRPPAAGNNLVMRSGETRPVKEEAPKPRPAAPPEKDELARVIVKDTPITGALPKPVPPPPSALAGVLPPSLAMYGPWIERGLYLGSGLLLGFLFHSLIS